MNRDRKITRFAAVLFTIAITSLFCIGLYLFNNKYTHGDLQPENGVLTVSEADLAQVHYLIDDWAFFPDVLLTPEQLQDTDARYPMTYLRIGSVTRFDGPGTRTNPHGSGTYALRMKLPEASHSYALELPEIYSSYRLYINGEEYFQIGNPDPEQYIARTKSEPIIFRASGETDIYLTVSDYTHFYSGLVYPPLFGSPEKVLQIREFRNAVTLFSIALGLILLIPTFYMGIKLKNQKALLFLLLCLVSCLVAFFPFIHTIVELPVFPWYTLELISIYLMPLLVIILHNYICNVDKKMHWSSICVSLFICCAACGYGMNSSNLTVPSMRMFSALILLYKLSVALYLLLTSCYSVNADSEQIWPLYYASISYSVIFLWDRILPEYEPILYGWFTDWANLILILSIGYSLLQSMLATYLNSFSFAEEHRQVIRQLAMQNEYTRQITKHNDDNRRIIHDFRQHLRMISVLSERIEPTEATAKIHDELRSYLQNISNQFFFTPESFYEPFSNNSTVDALLQYYYLYAKQNQINADFRLVSSNPELSDVEYCTLLGNLLENAVDACIRLPNNAKKEICLHSYETEHLLFIRIENTYDGLVFQNNAKFLSRKRLNHSKGIGMESARNIISKHGGTMDIYPLKDRFRVGISLPLK